VKKISTVASNRNEIFKEHKLTIGVDLGARSSHYCILDKVGDVILEHSFSTTPKGIHQVFDGIPRSRIALNYCAMRYLFALVLCTIILPIYGQEKRPQSGTNKNHADSVKKPVQESSPSSPPAQVNVVQEQAPAQQSDRAKSNPKSYLSRLFAPENIPNIGLLIAGIVGICVAIKTLKKLSVQTHAARIAANAAKHAAVAAEKEIEVASQQFVISNRPWVAVIGPIKVVEPLTFNATGAEGKILYSIKNAGNRPAIGVNTVNGIILGLPSALLQNAQNVPICDEGFTKAITMNGSFILPGEVQEMSEVKVINKSPFQTTANNLVSVWLQICIAYRDEFDNPHWTGLAWQYVTDTGENAFTPSGIVNGCFKPIATFNVRKNVG
jgi:hypothetical protein